MKKSNNISISKRDLWRYVNRKINRKIHSYHVFSVLTILFDEMLKDLKSGKKLNILNLGVLSLQTTKPRRHFNFKTKEVVLSKSYKILKFDISTKIKKKLCKLIDIDKTFKDYHE